MKRVMALSALTVAALGLAPASAAYGWGTPHGPAPGQGSGHGHGTHHPTEHGHGHHTKKHRHGHDAKVHEHHAKKKRGHRVVDLASGTQDVNRTIGNCSVISSSSFLGVNCGHIHGGGTKTIKKILKGDPVPKCWNEKMSPQQKRSLGLVDTDSETWYWVKCLSGINRKTLKVKPGGVKISWGYAAYPNDPTPHGPHVIFLTIHQQALVEMEEKDGTIPVPVAGVSPTAVPLVNQDVAFFDGTDSSEKVTVDNIVLRAHITKFAVDPTGGRTVNCHGPGVKVKRSDTRSSRPDACWYTFHHSSVNQPRHRFNGTVTATWKVTLSTDGGKSFAPFNTFRKTSNSIIEVKEVQSLVVP